MLADICELPFFHCSDILDIELLPSVYSQAFSLIHTLMSLLITFSAEMFLTYFTKKQSLMVPFHLLLHNH